MIFDKSNTNSEISGRVALYLNGLELDPDQITNTLLLKPTKAIRKGDVHVSSSGKKIVRKLGVWGYNLSEGSDINFELNVLLDILEKQKFNLSQLDNVDNAYIDVYFRKNIFDGNINFYFELDLKLIQRIEKLKLELRFELYGFDLD